MSDKSVIGSFLTSQSGNLVVKNRATISKSSDLSLPEFERDRSEGPI